MSTFVHHHKMSCHKLLSILSYLINSIYQKHLKVQAEETSIKTIAWLLPCKPPTDNKSCIYLMRLMLLKP